MAQEGNAMAKKDVGDFNFGFNAVKAAKPKMPRKKKRKWSERDRKWFQSNFIPDRTGGS